MNDLTGLYDDGTDLDSRLEQASYILKQAAAEEGVDLNQLSDEEVSGMLANIVNDEAGEGGYEGGKTAGDITVADVSLELTKRAAAEGLDLSQVDPGTYEELFNKVAEELSDPAYAAEAQKFASDAAYMDELGRIAARGFADEVDKLAGDDDDEDEDDKKVKKAALMLKFAAEGKAGIFKRTGDSIKKHWGKARDSERTFSENLGRRVHGGGRSGDKRPNQLAIRAAEPSGGSAALSNKHRRTGRAIVGAGAGTAAAGGTYAATRGGDGRKKKASIDELAFAVDVLREHGYDL